MIFKHCELVMKLFFPVQHHHIFRRQSFSSLKKSLMNPLMNSFLQNHVTLWNTLSSIFRCTFCTFRNPEKHKGYLLSQHTVQRQWIFRTFRFWFRFPNSGFQTYSFSEYIKYVLIQSERSNSNVANRLLCPHHTTLRKVKFFVQKFNFDKTPNIFTSCSPKNFLTFFLVKSKLSSAKNPKNPTF